MNRNFKHGAAAAALALLVWAGSALAHGDEHAVENHLVTFLGNFHPVVVHFPVALLLGAALAEFLLLVTRREFFTPAARFMVVIGAAGAAVAVTLGVMAEETTEFFGEYAELVETHEGFGIATLVLALLAAAASEIGRRIQQPRLILVYRVLLFAAAATVTAAGFFGGELVHGIGHYRW